MTLVNRIDNLFRRTRVDRNIDAELQSIGLEERRFRAVMTELSPIRQ
jgi:hypothetical protein